MYFISDAHIREQMYAHRPLIRSDFYRGLTSVACQIVEAGGDEAVIFPGDNTHFKKISAKDAQLLQQIVSTLQETGHPVYGIQGNHDFNEGVSWIEVCGGTSLDRAGKVDIEGLKVVGFDYLPGEDIFKRLEAMESAGLECDVLVLHQAFKHLCVWDPYALTVDDIPACVRRAVVSGHIHMKDIRLNTLGRQIVSVGSVIAGRFGEQEGCYLRYRDGVFEHIRTPVQRGMLRLRIKDEYDRDGALRQIAALDPNAHVNEWPLVEITFVNGYANDITPFKAYEDRAHLFYGNDLDQVSEEVKTEDVKEDVNWNDIILKCTANETAAGLVKHLVRDSSQDCLVSLREKFKMEMEEKKNAIKKIAAA
jgi:DNA repair exonuclease SbcCD nuclease subunit